MDLLIKVLNKILVYEGSFCAHPKDKGEPTNLGITLKTLQQSYADFEYGDFDKDGDVDIGPAIKAIELKGKLCGLYVDKSEQTLKGSLTIDEWVKQAVK